MTCIQGSQAALVNIIFMFGWTKPKRIVSLLSLLDCSDPDIVFAEPFYWGSQ